MELPWRPLPYARDLPDDMAGPPEWRCWTCCARSLRRLLTYGRAAGHPDDVAYALALEHLLLGHEPSVAELRDVTAAMIEHRRDHLEDTWRTGPARS